MDNVNEFDNSLSIFVMLFCKEAFKN